MNHIEEMDIYTQKAQKCLELAEDLFYSQNEKLSEIIDKNQKNSERIYCNKSTLQLGYFSPCPVEDLITGKSKRGKISVKKPLGKNLITYYFENNILKMAEDDIYYYLYDYSEAERIYIISVPKNRSLNMTLCLTVCTYKDGKIIEIMSLLANNAEMPGFPLSMPGMEMSFIKGSNDRSYMFDFTENQYSYSDGRIVALKTVKAASFGKKLSVREYAFNYKEDFYSSYICNDTQYKISEKRRYNEFYAMPVYP